MSFKTVNVRIKYGGQVMAYDCGELNPALGDWVLVAHNGELPYLGLVVGNPAFWPDELDCPCKGNGEMRRPVADILGGRRVLRLAAEADLALQAERQVREKDAFDYCLSRIAVQNLDMKLVAVEIVFDASKTIFYYTADERVDFRLLVKELVSRFRTRIEMRQIGSRHEARMLGGLGPCGQPFCCAGFLSSFAPVSVKMAKEQNISLSPTKISGGCGRLMCCLAFEHSGYNSKTRAPEKDLSAEDILRLEESSPTAENFAQRGNGRPLRQDHPTTPPATPAEPPATPAEPPRDAGDAASDN